MPELLPEGFIPDSAVDPSQLELDSPKQAIPEGFISDSELGASVVQPETPGAPLGFVPDSAVPPDDFLTQEQYLSKLPHASIVREVPAELAKAYRRGEMTPEQTKEIEPYLQAYRERADKQEFVQKNDLPESMKRGHEKAARVDTGYKALDASLNLLASPVPDFVLQMGQAMATGLVKQGQELVKGVAAVDPMTGQQISDEEQVKAKANSVQGLLLGTAEAANMVRTFVNRTANRLYGVTGDDVKAGAVKIALGGLPGLLPDTNKEPPKRTDMYPQYDAQFRQDLQVEALREKIIKGESLLGAVTGEEGLNRPTDAQAVEEIAMSPFAQPPLLIPGLSGFARTAKADSVAARLLTSAEKSGVTEARELAGKALAVPVKAAAKLPATAAKLLENNPLAAGLVAGTATAVEGGDVKDVMMASLLGVGAAKVGMLGKAAESIENQAAKLAGRVPNGPMGRYALRAFDAMAEGAQTMAVSQLANFPFLMGAEDEDAFKALLAGGVLAHAAGHATGSLTSSLNVGKNLWSTRETMPEVRTPVKDLGVDPNLDAAHLRVVDTLENSGNNFVQAVRDYFGKRGELYALFPDDYVVALDRAQAAGHLSSDVAAQAKGQQGISYTIETPDGPRRVALSKIARSSPGVSVGHESGHLLEHLLSPEELNHVYRQIEESYGPEQLAQYKDKYEWFANRTLGPGDPPVRLDMSSVPSEIFAEHVGAVLNSVPIAHFSDPSMPGAVDLSRSIYSLIGRGLEKIGAKRPELVGGKGAQTPLEIEPSAKLGRIIENVLEAHRLDQDVLDGTRGVGEPPVLRPLETAPDATEIPNSRPVVEKPPVQGFKKGDPLGDVKNADGTLIAEDAKVARVLDTINGERHYEIEYVHPDTGERLRGDVPEGWLQSRQGEPLPPKAEVIYPKSPVGENAPVGARVRTPDGRVKVGGELETPTNLIDSRSSLPAPRHVENTVRPETEIPAPERPNVRTTRERQRGFENQGTPEEQTHNEKVFREAAANRSVGTPFEIEHFGAKAPQGVPDQIVRERQRLASEAEPNELKQIWQKVFFPFKVNDTSVGTTVFGLSLDKIIQNVDILMGWQKEHGGVDPYFTSHEFARDVQNYLNNQANGYGGDGRRLKLPLDTKQGTITPENKNFKPVSIPMDRVEKINALMGYNPATRVTPATEAASGYFKRFAELNDVKVGKLANGLAEVNPYRDRLRKAGFNLNLLNQATEQIRLRDIVGRAKPRPDLNFKPGDTGITKAGFMPNVGIPETRVQGNQETRDVAKAYAERAGIDYKPHGGLEAVNEGAAKRIADAYEAAKDDPTNTEVQVAYRALIDETKAQYESMVEAGINIEPFTGKGEPYKNSKEMLRDVKENKHLYFLKTTEEAFGSGEKAGALATKNPMLEKSGIKIGETELLNNDLFRAVHDYFGHTAEGFEFGPRGEFNAYLAHSRLFGEGARPALAAETLAQNSWVNFGKHLRREDGSIPKPGDADFKALAERPFAEQKTTVVPRELLDEVHGATEAAFMPATEPLEHAVKEKTLDLVHYGQPGMKNVDPKFFGKSGLTSNAELAGEPKGFFFVKGGVDKNDPVAKRANVYETTIPGARIYDGIKDPLDYWSMINRSKADSMLMEAGYAGILARGGSASGGRKQVMMFEKTNITPQAARGKPSYMPSLVGPGEPFYSQLERTLEAIPAKASRQQIEAALRDGVKEKGQLKERPVKQEELADVKDQTGQSFAEWLKENPEATRQDMLDFVQQNEVRVGDSIRGVDEEMVASRNALREEKRVRTEIYDQASYDLVQQARGLFGFSRLDAANLPLRLEEGRVQVSELPAGLRTRAQDYLQYRREMMSARGKLARSLEEAAPDTKFDEYNLPGGENYREAVLTVPPRPMTFKEFKAELSTPFPEELAQQRYAEYVADPGRDISTSLNYRSSHFPDAQGYLAHVRYNERTDASGGKVLFAEEIQSDLHQAGRKKGYSASRGPDEAVAYEWVGAEHRHAPVETPVPGGEYGWSTDGGFTFHPTRRRANAAAASEARSMAKRGAPPDTPFKKSWPELTFKYLLRKAAEVGADRLAWTTGEQQAARYDLSKSISRIELQRGLQVDGEHFLAAYDHAGRRVVDKMVRPDEIENYIGKEAAKKLDEQPWKPYSRETARGSTITQDSKTLSGLDLKVGGEGMKGFYDKMLPGIADKIGKRYGVKVEDVSLSSLEPERAAFRKESGLPAVEGDSPVVHSLPITDTMRKDILDKGQPLFMPSPMAESHLSEFNGTDVVKAMRKPGWAILTGTQEKLGAHDAPANIAANAKLAAELTSRGLPFSEVGGFYEGVDQGTSFLVTGLSEKSAQALGKKFKQDSVLTNKGYVYQDGSVVPLNLKDTVVGPEAAARPGYTVLPDGTPVSAGLDFANKRAPDPRDTPIYKDIAQHLTERERATMRRDVAQDIVDQFKALPPDSHFEAASLLGGAKKGWYKRAEEALRAAFGPDTERFVAVLAATSPRQTVELNLNMAASVWHAWQKAGRPTDPVKVENIVRPRVALDNRVGNTVKALIGDATASEAGAPTGLLSGQKVESFRKNLLGDQEAVTNDSWMAQFAGIPQAQFGTKAGYAAMAAKVRRVAKKLNLTPAEVQETIWSFFKTLVETANVKTPAETVLHALTENDIKATPEFASELARIPRLAALLEASGHKPAVNPDNAGAGKGPLAGELLASGRSTQGVLGRIAKRAQAIKDAEFAPPEAGADNPF